MLGTLQYELLLVLLMTASWLAAMSWLFSKGLHSRQTGVGLLLTGDFIDSLALLA